MCCNDLTNKIKYNIENEIIDYDLITMATNHLVDLAIDNHIFEMISFKTNINIYVYAIDFKFNKKKTFVSKLNENINY